MPHAGRTSAMTFFPLTTSSKSPYWARQKLAKTVAGELSDSMIRWKSYVDLGPASDPAADAQMKLGEIWRSSDEDCEIVLTSRPTLNS